jgi:hypothetical protein
LKEQGAKAFPGQATAKCRDEPRLTYSGFARNCYQLSFPALGVVKVLEQLFKLALAPDEWGQLGTSTRIKSASDGTRTQNAPYPHGLLMALDGMLTLVSELK